MVVLIKMVTDKTQDILSAWKAMVELSLDKEGDRQGTIYLTSMEGNE